MADARGKSSALDGLFRPGANGFEGAVRTCGAPGRAGFAPEKDQPQAKVTPF